MAITVNTNVASLNAQRNLQGSGKLLNQSLQRLSSGLRINSAKDDAAGLAISDRMNAQVRGLNQAVRNANDGISLAQTAEGAMSEITNILQRTRELAIQSANATNSGTDRAALDAEVQQLKAEIDRIADTTTFNGRNLLDGSFTSQSFHIGSEANETITFTVAGARSNQIGQLAQATGAAVNDTASNGSNVTLQSGSGDVTYVNASSDYAVSGDVYRDGGSAYAKAAAINGSNIGDINASASTSQTGAAAMTQVSSADGSGTYTLNINGVDIYDGETMASGGSLAVATIVDQINLHSTDTGVTASLESGGELTLSATDGRDIVVTEAAGGDAAESITGDANFTSGSEIKGTITLTSAYNMTVGGAGAVIGHTSNITVGTDGMNTIDVLNVANANTAIQRVDAALARIDSNRGDLGAVQNRFDSTIANLMNVSENISAAKSRIVDADFATETANLTKSQILQQAGLAMLAQANTVPQAALTLLQG
jgi:flagellin